MTWSNPGHSTHACPSRVSALSGRATRLPQPGWPHPSAVEGHSGLVPSAKCHSKQQSLPLLGNLQRTQSSGLSTDTLSLRVLWHSGLGPQEVTRRKGKQAEAPVQGRPSPTAITGNEREQEKPSRRLLISPPQVSSRNTPFPLAKPPTKSLDPRPGGCAVHRLDRVDLLDRIHSRDCLSLQAQEKPKTFPPPCKLSMLRGRTHRCFRGLLNG